jgi:hypothetical protein
VSDAKRRRLPIAVAAADREAALPASSPRRAPPRRRRPQTGDRGRAHASRGAYSKPLAAAPRRCARQRAMARQRASSPSARCARAADRARRPGQRRRGDGAAFAVLGAIAQQVGGSRAAAPAGALGGALGEREHRQSGGSASASGAGQHHVEAPGVGLDRRAASDDTVSTRIKASPRRAPPRRSRRAATAPRWTSVVHQRHRFVALAPSAARTRSGDAASPSGTSMASADLPSD